MASNSQVVLSSGAYYTTSLQLEPQARLVIDDSAGPVVVYVASSFMQRGRITSVSGQPPRVLFGLFGTTTAYLESPVPGAVIAPRASVVLGTGSTPPFEGVYFAREVRVRAGTVVRRVP